MPRRAPDGKGVTEHRITFGNYERQFVTDVKNDIEKGVKIATITAAAVPLATFTGLGLLGYGLYKGGQMIGKGLNEFSMMDWSIGPGLPNTEQREAAVEGYSEWQKVQLSIYAFSGGYFGLSHEDIEKQNQQS